MRSYLFFFEVSTYQKFIGPDLLPCLSPRQRPRGLSIAESETPSGDELVLYRFQVVIG